MDGTSKLRLHDDLFKVEFCPFYSRGSLSLCQLQKNYNHLSRNHTLELNQGGSFANNINKEAINIFSNLVRAAEINHEDILFPQLLFSDGARIKASDYRPP